MTGELPKFCEILDQIIREIAAENGEDPKELKSLLAKGEEKEADTAATVPASVNSEHPTRAKNGGVQ